MGKYDRTNYLVSVAINRKNHSYEYLQESMENAFKFFTDTTSDLCRTAYNALNGAVFESFYPGKCEKHIDIYLKKTKQTREHILGECDDSK